MADQWLKDSSGSGADLSVTGSVVNNSNGYLGGSADFTADTGSDKLTTTNSNLNITGNWTVEYFLRMDTLRHTVMTQRMTSWVDNDINLWTEYAADNTLTMAVRRAGGWTTGKTNANPIVAGTWNHVAFVFIVSTSMLIYVNGTVNTQFSGVGLGATSVANDTFEVGNLANTYQLDGAMDELRVSNTARYNANFTAPTQEFKTDANTKGLWHFDSGEFMTTNTNFWGNLP